MSSGDGGGGGGGAGSSVDLSIFVMEAGSSESLCNQSSSNSCIPQKQQLLSLPPRTRGRSSTSSSSSNSGSVSVSVASGDKCVSGMDAGGADGSQQAAALRWQDMGSGEDGECCEEDEGDNDDMAERVLQTLQRKDELLAEQARRLEQREKEVEELQGEKRLLIRQLHGLLCHTKSLEAARDDESENLQRQSQRGKENGAVPESVRLVEQERLLVCVDSQLRDERAERQQDAGYFRAHIHQLTMQLAQAQSDASTREAKHAQDLEAIHREMQELSTLVDEMHTAKATLQRTRAQLEDAMEAKMQCQQERDRLVQMLQSAMRRERAEHQCVVSSLREEVQALQFAAAAAQEKCCSADAVRATAAEEVRTLQHNLQCMVAEQAALTLQMEAVEQQLRQAQEQRATAIEARQQMRAELDSMLQEVMQLRAARDAQNALLAEEDKRRESLHAEVAHCAHGAQQLEGVVMEVERRRQEAAAREACVREERDRLRLQLQRITTTNRQELLEQQQLAEEMASFHRAKLQQQRQWVERLEQEAAVARKACVVLQSTLERTQQRLEETTVELQPLQQRAAALETALAAAQDAHRGCAAREHEASVKLEELRMRLQQRERARRKLREQVQRMEESEQRRRLVSASDSLLRHINRQQRHQHECQRGQEQRHEFGGAACALEQSISTLSLPNTSTTVTMAPLRGSILDKWREKLQASESRNQNLEQQLGAKQKGYHVLLNERKTLMQRMHTLQAGAQGQLCVIERQHREALRHLEEAHRRRTLSACRDTVDEAKRRESLIQRGIARIVTELMDFTSALEAYVVPLLQPRCPDANASAEPVIMQEERENVLRAACDNITRNFLGVEGGWESLLQHPLCSHSNKRRNPTSIAMRRRRIRCLLAEYLQLQLLPKSSSAFAAAETRRGGGDGGSRKRLSAGVTTTTTTINGIEDAEDDEKLRYFCLDGENGNRVGQPLVELLMECVRFTLDEDAA